MNSGVSARLLLAGLALGVIAQPQSVLACAACFGQSNDSMAQGMNLGIFALLVVIVSVLIGLASFGVFLARRSARLAANGDQAAASARMSAEPARPISRPTP